MSLYSSTSCGGGSVNYIEHHVSKMDTLAGVAIKYGVEVADVKKMNGLVTDLQMFALKSLRIPLPGRHPLSPNLSNGSATSRETSAYHQNHTDVLESFQSLRLKSPQLRVSSAMSSLQGYYGLKPQNKKIGAGGTDMSVYSPIRARYLEDEMPKHSPVSDPPPSRHRKTRSLANGFLLDNCNLTEDLPVAEVESFNDKSVRRRQKADPADPVSPTPEMLLKEESNGGSTGFLAKTGKGLALRPKSTSRMSLTSDTDSGWSNSIPLGILDSVMADGFSKVRKSSSTSNLQDQENNDSSSSIWPTSKWSLKPELQALSASSLTRPIFDGLPKPITGRRNKAALD